MGQIIQRIIYPHEDEHVKPGALMQRKFPDLSELPPEISLLVLSNLNATDLCLAACVWDKLGNDEVLWQSLCKSCWGSVSVYRRVQLGDFSYRKLYLILDEATLTFNGDPFEGEAYLIKHRLVDGSPMELAKFIHTGRKIKPQPRRVYLDKRRDVLDCVMQLQDYENQFLPNAMRTLFSKISAPPRGGYLEQIIDKFAERFCSCNPKLGLQKDAVYLLCFSLIMLSVDLSSPHVKNKMSKREFIKNTKRATAGVDEDLVGHLYDNIYLIGHVATT
ncbi:F-box only protein 8 [Mactra antiquata]